MQRTRWYGNDIVACLGGDEFVVMLADPRRRAPDGSWQALELASPALHS